MLLGTVIGTLATYKGFVGSLFNGLINIFVLLPKLITLIVLSTFIGSSTTNLIILISAFSWVGIARNIRAKVIHLNGQPFIENCVIQGYDRVHIAVYHIIPNLSDVLLSRFLLGVNSCIMMESTLSFLGFGDTYYPTWGTMINFAYSRGAFLRQAYNYLLVPGVLFEEFGFKYYGPVNGHDLSALMTVLENVKGMDRPVLIHIETKKGKGYAPAEKNPDLFHGVSPFHIQTGELKKKSTLPTYTSVFGKTLAQLGAQDERIVGITAAMGKGTGINIFQEQFPNRTIDVGIAEEHAVTMAAAMALDGYKPVVAIYSTFLQRAYDQVMHDVALQNAPVVFCLDRAGLVGDDGPTHHGIFDVSYLRHIPNMVCMAPKDENELRHMLYSALAYNCPVAVRYPRGEGLGVPMDDALQVLPLGKAEVLQEGSRVTLLALGSMVHIAQQVAVRLQDEMGITATVINARFAKPLDAETIMRYASDDTLLVTLEEQAVTGGFGSAVLELLNQNGMDTRKVLTIGIADAFVQHGNTAILKEMQGLDVDSITAKVKERLG